MINGIRARVFPQPHVQVSFWRYNLNLNRQAGHWTPGACRLPTFRSSHAHKIGWVSRDAKQSVGPALTDAGHWRGCHWLMCLALKYGGFLKWWYTKSPILIGFSIINHPFWGTPIFGNTHMGEIENPCFSLWQKFLTPDTWQTSPDLGSYWNVETSILKSCWVPRVALNAMRNWQNQAISLPSPEPWSLSYAKF